MLPGFYFGCIFSSVFVEQAIGRLKLIPPYQLSLPYCLEVQNSLLREASGTHCHFLETKVRFQTCQVVSCQRNMWAEGSVGQAWEHGPRAPKRGWGEGGGSHHWGTEVMAEALQAGDIPKGWEMDWGGWELRSKPPEHLNLRGGRNKSRQGRAHCQRGRKGTKPREETFQEECNEQCSMLRRCQERWGWQSQQNPWLGALRGSADRAKNVWERSNWRAQVLVSSAFHLLTPHHITS